MSQEIVEVVGGLTPSIVSGDSAHVLAVLKRRQADGSVAAVDLSAATAITAMLVSGDHSLQLTAEFSVSPSATDADWVSGLVAIDLSEADTLGILYQHDALIEVQVTMASLGGKRTWFVPCYLVPGNVA